MASLSAQDFLLPPVVNPPEITNDIEQEDDDQPILSNIEVPEEDVSVESLTGTKKICIDIFVFLSLTDNNPNICR